MKKKALIVVNLAGFLHFLWNDIATLQEMGYEVSVAMNENSAAGPNLIEIPKLEEMGIAHYQVEFDTKSPVSTQNIQAYKQLKLILKTNKYDLIHCHTPIVGILTRMAARKYRKAGTTVIYTTHGFAFTDKSSKKSWIVYFTAEKLMSRFCDAIITINHEDYTGIAHEIKTMLSRFAAISVRDENSAHIVRQLLGYSPEIHMDPVLMYDFTQEIAEYTTYERDYIILYAYTGRLSREEENYIKKFAKRHNKRIICVGHYSNIADSSMLSRLAAMAGREVGSLISMVLRDFLSIQFRSALVYGTSG